ncbi:hypothetical protein DFH09DRAFT_1303300 [Mycena vulgaris]|nr:hypothetical protein DFH09DRAFT_1303300 [Mycena vulgaris]
MTYHYESIHANLRAAALMLQSAQPYPGDSHLISPDECFDGRRFLMYPISDNEYLIMDNQRDTENTISVESLHNPDFMPALWYAQLLLDTSFDLSLWYNEAAVDACTAKDPEAWTCTGSDLNLSSDDLDSMPSLGTVPCSEPSDAGSMPGLQSVSDSSDSDSDIPDLQSSVSDLSASESSNNKSDRVMPGDSGETLEDHLRTWARAAEEYGRSSVQARTSLRSRHLGDVLGDTVAALLDFFQPHPGDEQVPWGDERCDSVRFHGVPVFNLLGWYARNRAESFGIPYHETLAIHRFPIEELLGDAVQQYFRDIGYHVPMFCGVGMARIPLEPEDLDGGPDSYLVTIPVGEGILHEQISKETLLNPKLDLAGWVLKRQWKFLVRESQRQNKPGRGKLPQYLGSLFDEPDLDPEGEFILYCRGIQIPADSMKGISRTASTPRVVNRVVARPLVIVVRVNGEPTRALVDSGSLGDLISTSLADQLRLRRQELSDPITLQLAVQGSRSKINHSAKVKFSYQDISEEHTFFIANLSGYDMILGTAWLFQHKESQPRKSSLEQLVLMNLRSKRLAPS